MDKEKIKIAIDRIQSFEPKEGYYLAFSGGKDSVVVKRLMDMAGVKYDAHYRVTSVDPPELVMYIKEKHPDVWREVPHDRNGKPITMWNLIPRKLMPPTRIVRYCCSELKETGGDGRMAVTGVRWAESARRKESHGVVTIPGKNASKQIQSPDFRQSRQGGIVLVNDNSDSRRMIESCYKRQKTMLNPIIDWVDRDVWDFIRAENIPYCKLYDEGWHRLGCIGCPMAQRHGREKQFARWPKYKQGYLRAFVKMLKVREERGKIDGSWRIGTTAQDVFNWWMEYDTLRGQVSFDDYEEVP